MNIDLTLIETLLERIRDDDNHHGGLLSRKTLHAADVLDAEVREAKSAAPDKRGELMRSLARVCWDGGSLDGGELQELLVAAGVLVPAQVEKPCGDACACADNDAYFPTTCYRLAEQRT